MALAPRNVRLDQPGDGSSAPGNGLVIPFDPAGDTIKAGSDGIEVALADGSVVVNIGAGDNAQDDDSDHDDNLALKLGDSDLASIANDLLQGIEADERSRQEWLETRALGIRLLGLKLEQPTGDIGAASAPLAGMSTVRDPTLLEAVVRFQANARGELLPANGPVKVANELLSSGAEDVLADKLQKSMNFYLTTVATEYYPDTDRMLFFVGFSGSGFKKVYNCPIRQRPVSESVDANDIIVSNAASDMGNAQRVTQRIMMRRSVLKRMQLAGAYRDVDLTLTPHPVPNAADREAADVQGVAVEPSRPEDKSYTIYECYCELDLPGFEHKQSGKATGLPLPYRVVLEKDSRQVLEIRRNWDEDDERCLAKRIFVKYPYIPALGFYDIGLVHLLGNLTNALTAAEREMLDAGMFASFPGFLYAKSAGRQNTNEFRVPPGGGAPIETEGQPIANYVMPLPYKDPSPGLMALVEAVQQTAQRLGGTAEINVGEGRQDAPVGTTLALIEQATKVMDAVHKRIHAAQAEEFQLLKECFRRDPQSFVRSMKGAIDWDEQEFLAALDDADLVPMADPNTPSHMHRLMRAMGVKQLQAMSPQLYNAREVDTRVLKMIGVDDPETLFNPPPPPGAMPAPPPQIAAKAIETAQKAQQSRLQAQVKLAGMHQQVISDAMKSADAQKDRESKERIAALKLAESVAIHPQSEPAIAQTMGDVNPPPSNPTPAIPTEGPQQ